MVSERWADEERAGMGRKERKKRLGEKQDVCLAVSVTLKTSAREKKKT